MSGESIPYHLRVNKHIDREIFVELIRRVGQYVNIDQYEYIGFGAAHLHDFKHIHNVFGFRQMHSLETEPHVYQRQLINRQFSCINCNLKSSEDFVSDFPKVASNGGVREIESPIILWLDYTKASDLSDQLSEFKSMIEKVANHSVIKITLNAHYQTLGRMDGLETIAGENARSKRMRLEEKRYNTFNKRLGVFANDIVLKPENFNEKAYPKYLYDLLSIVSVKATEGLNRKFVKLTSSSYKDGQSMLTLTGVVLDKAKIDDFYSKTGFKNWPFYNDSSYDTINVPSLSRIEKGIIDKYLPDNANKLLMRKCVNNFEVFVDAISNYKKYYRQYPNFLKGEL